MPAQTTKDRRIADRLTEPHGTTLREAGRLIATTTAIVAMAAGLIHVSAAVDHRDMTAMLVGFLVVAALQVALALVLLWRRPRAPVLAAGIALMIVSVGLWVLSRTNGIPFVPGAHQEGIGVADGVTVLFELAAIPGLLLLLSREVATMSLPSHRLGTRAVSLVGAGAFALMAPALILGDRHRPATDGAHTAGGHTQRAGALPHAGNAGAHPGGAAVASHKGRGSGKHARGRHTARHASGSRGGHAGHSSGAGTVLAVSHGHGSGSAPAGHNRHGSSGSNQRGHGGSGSGSPHHGNHGGGGNPSGGGSGGGSGENPGSGGGGGGQPSPSQTVESLVQSVTDAVPPR